MANDTLGKITYAMRLILEPTIKPIKAEIDQLTDVISTAVSKGFFSDETIEKASQMMKHVKAITSRDADSEEAAGVKNQVTAMNAITSGENKIADEGIKMVKKTVGLLEDIHQRLVTASPLLRTIESLFNLAVQLFFMPLGNKLAEVMIPAVIELVDQVTALWATFEGKSLGEILETMLSEGARIFGGYFIDLANQLAGEGTILGSIASLLEAVGSFIQGDMVNVLKAGLTIFTFIVENLKEIIATVIAFKVASLANQVATMWVIAASSTSVLGTNINAGYAAAAAGTAATAAIGTGAGLTAYNYMNNGGDFWGAAGNAAGSMALLGPASIPATVARQKIVGEASGISTKKETTIHNTFNFNGLTDSQLEKKVRNIQNEQYNNHRLNNNYG